MDHTPNGSPGDADAGSIEQELAAELVRGFAAVDALLQGQYEHTMWQTPDRVAHELADRIASEAIDHLGSGERLDPWEALAFRAPVGSRSHGVTLTDEPELSADVRAVQAELLRRGVTILGEDQYNGRRSVTVSSYVREWAEEAVADLLPERDVDWAAQTPHRIVPAPCQSWQIKADDAIRVWVSVCEHEHLVETRTAEDDDKVVVLAFVSTPSAGDPGPLHGEPAMVDLDQPVAGRQVLDGFGEGRPLPGH